MKTGVIGLGAMGYRMALNLNRTGLLETVWNRTKSKADAFAHETGGSVANNPSKLAASCVCVLISVSRDEDVLAVIDALLPGVKPGTIVIDTSTVAVKTAKHCADKLSAVSAHFLDAPVSGGVEGAKQGALAVMVGGDDATVTRAMPVLNAVGKNIVHMGPVGYGQATKAVNQIMAAGINQAVTEALAFAQAMDLPIDKVIDVVGRGAAGNWFLAHRGSTMTQDIFEPGFKVALHDKDLEIIQSMVSEKNTKLPIVEMTRIHYQRLMDSGYQDDDISALFRIKRKLFQDDT